MSPIYRFHDGKGTRTIDLRGVQSIYRHDGRNVWAVGGLNYLFDVPASVGEELEAAWLAYSGEHAPRPDEAGPGLLLSHPHPLPTGWRWRGEQVVGPEGAAVYVDDDGDVVFESTWYAPPDVLLTVIAAHRARVGGAS